MAYTESQLPFTADDLHEVENQIKQMRMGALIGFALSMILGVVLWWQVNWITGMLCFVILSTASMFFFQQMIRKKQAEMGATHKIRLIGKPDALIIDQPGTTISWHLTGDGHVHMHIQTPGGREEVKQPLVLAPGQRDEYFYRAAFGERKIDLNRADFFKLAQSETVTLDITERNSLIRVIS